MNYPGDEGMDEEECREACEGNDDCQVNDSNSSNSSSSSDSNSTVCQRKVRVEYLGNYRVLKSFPLGQV